MGLGPAVKPYIWDFHSGYKGSSSAMLESPTTWKYCSNLTRATRRCHTLQPPPLSHVAAPRLHQIAGQVGLGWFGFVRFGSGWVGFGQVGPVRVELGRVGSGRVGSVRVGRGR